jgi:hypothetical protein
MKSREPAGPPRKRKPPVDVKVLLDVLMKKIKTHGDVPFEVKLLREDRKVAYALKLTELARVLEVWANTITPKTVEPEVAVPDAVRPPCEVGTGVI